MGRSRKKDSKKAAEEKAEAKLPEFCQHPDSCNSPECECDASEKKASSESLSENSSEEKKSEAPEVGDKLEKKKGKAKPPTKYSQFGGKR